MLVFEKKSSHYSDVSDINLYSNTMRQSTTPFNIYIIFNKRSVRVLFCCQFLYLMYKEDQNEKSQPLIVLFIVSVLCISVLYINWGYKFNFFAFIDLSARLQNDKKKTILPIRHRTAVEHVDN